MPVAEHLNYASRNKTNTQLNSPRLPKVSTGRYEHSSNNGLKKAGTLAACNHRDNPNLLSATQCEILFGHILTISENRKSHPFTLKAFNGCFKTIYRALQGLERLTNRFATKLPVVNSPENFDQRPRKQDGSHFLISVKYCCHSFLQA